jgi:hypothetical protein
MENGIEKVAGAVAGERAAGTVRSVGAGREAQNQHARMGIAERRNRPAPVLPISVGAATDAGYLRAVGAQPRTSFAGDDTCI